MPGASPASIRPKNRAMKSFFLDFIPASVEGQRNAGTAPGNQFPENAAQEAQPTSAAANWGTSCSHSDFYWPCALLKLLWISLPVSVSVILLSWESFTSNDPSLFRGPLTVILSPGFRVSLSQPSALRSAFAPPSSACHR